MIRCLAVAGVVLLISNVALAQRPPVLSTSRSSVAAEAPLLSSAPTVSGAMPAPAQMAGLPLQVGDLPPGTVVIRLIRGDFSHRISGHEVELHVGGDGEVRRATTDSDGRAHYAGLTVGTPVHAVAIVNGERLESQSFTLPPRGGVRMMLVAGAGAGAPANSLSVPTPSRSAGPGRAWASSRITLLSALLGAGGLLVAVVFRRHARAGRARASDREDLFEQLVDLEERWAVRRISERRYRTSREALMQELERLTEI